MVAYALVVEQAGEEEDAGAGGDGALEQAGEERHGPVDPPVSPIDEGEAPKAEAA